MLDKLPEMLDNPFKERKKINIRLSKLQRNDPIRKVMSTT